MILEGGKNDHFAKATVKLNYKATFSGAKIIAKMTVEPR